MIDPQIQAIAQTRDCDFRILSYSGKKKEEVAIAVPNTQNDKEVEHRHRKGSKKFKFTCETGADIEAQVQDPREDRHLIFIGRNHPMSQGTNFHHHRPRNKIANISKFFLFSN